MGAKLLADNHHFVVNQLHLTYMKPRVIPRHGQYDVEDNVGPAPVGGAHKSILEPRYHQIRSLCSCDENIENAGQHTHVAAHQRIPRHIPHPVEQKPPVLFRFERSFLNHAQQALHRGSSGLHVSVPALVRGRPLERRVLPSHVFAVLLVQSDLLLLRASHALLVAARMANVPRTVQHDKTPLTSSCGTAPRHLQHSMSPWAAGQLGASCVRVGQRLIDFSGN
mmetsp:Transcript_72564/g.193514  ORF Transcript_72564/g.193514 Transcript_72564/m.193514 type:complete len:223 (+) Transcript_72564:1103-1771(+)